LRQSSRVAYMRLHSANAITNLRRNESPCQLPCSASGWSVPCATSNDAHPATGIRQLCFGRFPQSNVDGPGTELARLTKTSRSNLHLFRLVSSKDATLLTPNASACGTTATNATDRTAVASELCFSEMPHHLPASST
jgi:hypothetical protein